MTLSPSADQFYLTGTFNFRDLGGLRTIDGARIRPGVLLRSAQLSGLDLPGHAILRELGVADVYDLRGHREIDHIGHDNLPDGVRLNLTPFDSRMAEAPPHDAQTNSAFAHMLEVYRYFPTLPEANTAIIAIAETIASGDGAVLVHCAAGKDRTGWAIATLLRAVAVSEADVLADFLASNDAVPALRAMMAPKLTAGVELSIDILGVREDYLQAATDAVHEQHGDVESYLTAIGFTAQLRERLRDRLLE
ncbi:tyrosine-protein phosphatase [Nocardia sp. NPDC004604]|uniref:tyrosine-protein phosphatase n=1 Tax=Nocardia sp. NPDC004604 TaxID=3157013 RepID=UPI0033B6BFAA